jgi:hypothetical protein
MMGTFTTSLSLGKQAFGVSGGLDPQVITLTVGLIRVTETLPKARLFTHDACYQEEYMCLETGVGGGTLWQYGKDIFATRADAEQGVIAAQQRMYMQRALRDKQQAESVELLRTKNLKLLQQLKSKYEIENLY